MLPKRHKLSRATFPSRKEQKLSWGGKALRIYAYVSEQSVVPQFAVVVPKKLCKKAVSRNLFKRRVLAAIRVNMNAFERFSCKKYVVFPKALTNDIPQKSIEEDIRSFLREYAKK
ncbi:MAG: hypothetical protein A3D65_05460 [Candidatus Lloydbacteria bacterium RIFCSPHIGHO2_02_FULL_50_13]|uniref:Uncharacterized protein n=1 Tax=Candidatus Lloydbacteria bacterium RIFCSPHIGHO2_02_FULL_50_13 TaxID=1798661 RepID=A0A1G2D7X2_9BACT|nr:MAG: hypothetical protein A3D65_05460 [Candidatus Lloydbacteria bacterium RIFCSPHIGHO2_02_FULL_50_13]